MVYVINLFMVDRYTKHDRFIYYISVTVTFISCTLLSLVECRMIINCFPSLI